MEKIDLTKCVNCRFRAKVDGNEVEGRIAVAGDYLQFFYSNGDIYSIYIPSYWEHGKVDYFDDFEIVPRDPETYLDWQVGDIIYNLDDEGNTVSGEDEMCKVIFRSGELVAIAENYSSELADINGCYTCSQLFRAGWRLVLTDIEQQIIEAKKKYGPQDGDIIAFGCKAVGIFRNFEQLRHHRDYVTLSAGRLSFDEGGWISDKLHPATEEEQQRLFDAMTKEGKRWNAEKKVVEDIPKPYEFKKGEPVLVRTEYGRDWKLSAYVELSSIPDATFGKYGVTDGRVTLFYRFCLPYNEKTMHLLGTGEDYKEDEK